MTTTILFLTDIDCDTCEVYIIPEGPIADAAAAITGTEYNWPPQPDDEDDEREEVNEDVERVVNACLENSNDWHQGNLMDAPLELPREPVRVSHILVVNAPSF